MVYLLASVQGFEFEGFEYQVLKQLVWGFTISDLRFKFQFQRLRSKVFVGLFFGLRIQDS